MAEKLKKVIIPSEKAYLKTLKAGEKVLLSGKIYVARDQAHLRLAELLKENKKLPIPILNQVIFYAGPTPTPPGKVIGAIGPTTASRMDKFTPVLYQLGLAATIGKGPRSEAVQKAIMDFGGVYFAATGGAAALLSQKVKKAKIVAYPELGTEAIYELQVIDFPAVVAIDSKGQSIYK
jgi:fumarate hydratase subunit beta